MDANERGGVIFPGSGYATERGTKSLAGYPQDRGLALSEVQQVFGRAAGTIRAWVKAGRLHPTKSKGWLVFPRAEVEALLEKDKPVTLTARQFWERAHPTGSAEVIDALVAAHLADNPFEALKAVAAKYQL